MKKFEILEHKADLKIRAFGKEKPELFLNMLLGMTESQNPRIESREEIKREIKIKSIDLPALLVDFLNEVLYLSQMNKEVYFDTVFKKITDTEIEAELIGQKVRSFGEDIKAATFHNLEVKQTENKNWEGTVLFDI
jgi:SHS2 domain-containing protein